MIVYPPPFKGLVLDHKKANVSVINAALNQVDWEILFSNESANQQVIVFSQTVMSVFSNFVLNKFVTFNDGDPPWMTPNNKDKINYRNSIYREYLKKGKQEVDYLKLQKNSKGIIKININ